MCIHKQYIEYTLTAGNHLYGGMHLHTFVCNISKGTQISAYMYKNCVEILTSAYLKTSACGHKGETTPIKFGN